MYKVKYDKLVCICLIISNLFSNNKAIGGKFFDFEENILIGPKNFVPIAPKCEWEVKKPQGFKANKKLNESKKKNSYGSQKSFIITRDIDGNIEFHDSRY